LAWIFAPLAKFAGGRAHDFAVSRRAAASSSQGGFPAGRFGNLWRVKPGRPLVAIAVAALLVAGTAGGMAGASVNARAALAANATTGAIATTGATTLASPSLARTGAISVTDESVHVPVTCAASGPACGGLALIQHAVKIVGEHGATKHVSWVPEQIGSARYTLAPGQASTVSIRITLHGMRMLVARGSLPVTVTFLVGPSADPTTAINAHIVLHDRSSRRPHRGRDA
jgi:hypothetical protein